MLRIHPTPSCSHRPRVNLALVAALGAAVAPVALAQEKFLECSRALYSFPHGSSPSLGDGLSLASVPDVNGDGFPELLVGSPGDPFSSQHAPGRIHLRDGRTGIELFHVDGVADDELGLAVSPAGDIDRDGIGDLLAGAPGIGAARVFSGVDGELLLEVTGLAGSFGHAVAGVGDLDADHVPDLAVAEVDATRVVDQHPGRVSLVSGADGHELHSLTGGDDPGFGREIVPAGDLNGDQRMELAVLAGSSGSTIGRVGVIDLRTFNELSSISGPFDEFRHASSLGVPSPSSFVGFPRVPVLLITGALDLDPPVDSLDHGIARLVYPTTGQVLRTYTGRNLEFFGPGVALTSDLDSDHVLDFALLGFGPGSETGFPNNSWVGVFSTRTGALLRQVHDASGHPEALADVIALPDLDGDGLAELAVSQWLVPGGEREVVVLASEAPIETFGVATAGSGGIQPQLSIDACPRLGNSVHMETERVLGGALGVVVAGLVRADQPVRGGILYPRPDFRFAHRATGSSGVAGAGDASIAVRIPDNPSLVGVNVFVQAAYFDRGAAGSVAFSRALRLRLY